jgi:uncharacterized protein YggU (UPF0235/DUF167 family)
MFLKVKVFPNSKKEEIIKKLEDEFEIKVKEKAERGEANKRVKEVLARYLNISEEKLILIRGAKQRNKIFKIIKDQKLIF